MNKYVPKPTRVAFSQPKGNKNQTITRIKSPIINTEIDEYEELIQNLSLQKIEITEEERTEWKVLLLNFESEIINDCVQYLTRKNIIPIERELYVDSILWYYNEQKKLPEFIRYMVQREIYNQYENDTNHHVSTFFGGLFSIAGKCIMKELNSNIIKKLNKIKMVTIEEIEKTKNEKYLVKIKKCIEKILNSIINCQSIPDIIQYSYYIFYYSLSLKNTKELMRTMIRYIFRIPLNSIMVILMKQNEEYMNIFLAMTKLINLLIDEKDDVLRQ